MNSILKERMEEGIRQKHGNNKLVIGVYRSSSVNCQVNCKKDNDRKRGIKACSEGHIIYALNSSRNRRSEDQDILSQIRNGRGNRRERTGELGSPAGRRIL